MDSSFCKESKMGDFSNKPFLEYALIPLNHRAHSYIKTSSIQFLNQMAWNWGAARQLQRRPFEILTEQERSDIFTDGFWKEIVEEKELEYGSPAYYEERRQELKHQGYTIL